MAVRNVQNNELGESGDCSCLRQIFGPSLVFYLTSMNSLPVRAEKGLTDFAQIDQRLLEPCAEKSSTLSCLTLVQNSEKCGMLGTLIEARQAEFL